MAAPVVLHYGLPYGSGGNPWCDVCPSLVCDVLPTALCGGSSLVVEVFLQLCVCWAVPLLILDLVFGIEVGVGGCVAGDGVFDVHVDDFVGLCIVLWHSWIYLLLLVHKEDLWGSQG